mmetsp:Transcript_20768/g.29318  ORF Transcript_20768/g.29318 Transcript_20768/m.29318 type:complete len:1004 (-) Transcript_20768:58-3069(-)
MESKTTPVEDTNTIAAKGSQEDKQSATNPTEVDLSLANLTLEDPTTTTTTTNKSTDIVPSKDTNSDIDNSSTTLAENTDTTTKQQEGHEPKQGNHDETSNRENIGTTAVAVDKSGSDSPSEFGILSLDDFDPIASLYEKEAGLSSPAFGSFDFLQDDPDLLNVLQSLGEYRENNDDDDYDDDNSSDPEDIPSLTQEEENRELLIQDDNLSDFSVEESENLIGFLESTDLTGVFDDHPVEVADTNDEQEESSTKKEKPEDFSTPSPPENKNKTTTTKEEEEEDRENNNTAVTDLLEGLGDLTLDIGAFEEEDLSYFSHSVGLDYRLPFKYCLPCYPEEDNYCIPCPPEEEDVTSELPPLDESELPPYTYCIPCPPKEDDDTSELPPLTHPSGFLPSIDESSAVESSSTPKIHHHQQQLEQQLALGNDTFAEELLKASLFNMEDNHQNNGTGQEEEDYQRTFDSHTQAATYDDNNHNTSYPVFTVSQRPEALYAAEPILKSFGTEPYDPPHEQDFTPKNERSCFGHKETIFGLSFSECGTFMATAGQDSTICVWDVHTNALLSQLNGHSKDFECLRTAWASPHWGKTQIPRGEGAAGGPSDENANHDGNDDISKNNKYAYIIASAGANGIVHIWTSSDATQKNSWTCIGTIDHASLGSNQKKTTSATTDNIGEDTNADDEEKEEEENVPQVYALSFVDHWQAFATDEETQNSFLITASDDYVHLWEIELGDKEKEESEESDDGYNDNFAFKEVMSIRFTDMHKLGGGVSVGRVTSSGFVTGAAGDNELIFQTGPTKEGGGNAFGGSRNPDDLVYVFDASYCSGNGLLGVALSDGTLRLLNGRGVCVSILSLPGCESHLTSFSWDSTGTRIATCVATGHLILWTVDIGDGKGKAAASCVAVLEGGHQLGRPLFGAKYCGGYTEELLVSWGVDGRVCLWDSRSDGQIHAPISTLVYKQSYPVYAVDVANRTHKDENKNESVFTSLALAGGRDGGFLGVPVYIYDVPR